MARLFYQVMQDSGGNLLFDVTGTMRIAGTGTLATIYGDEGLSVILPNPLTNHPNFASFKCFLPVGDFDFYMAKPGYTFETLTGVQGLGTLAQQDASAVSITGGHVNSLTGLSANTAVFNDLTATLAHISSGQISGMTGIAAETAVFTDLTATDATITSGYIADLTANVATISSGYITDLTANVAHISGGQISGMTGIAANTATFLDLTANTAHISGGQISGMTGIAAETATFTDLTANAAHISSGQISGMTGIAATTGAFTDLTANVATISSGNITDLTATAATISSGQISGMTGIAAETAVFTDMTANAAHISSGQISGMTGIAANTATFNDLTATVVTIAGGTASLASVHVPDQAGSDKIALHSQITLAGGTNRWGVYHQADAPSYFGGNLVLPLGKTLRLGTYTPASDYGAAAEIFFANTASGIQFRPDADTAYPCVFRNAANTLVGSIATSDTATTFTTSSDVRLKHAVAALTGALGVVRALRPVTFLWNANDEPGVGYLAHELQQVVPEAVTGLPDEVHEDGSIKPQGVDHSKLVPWLTAALQETLAHVEALTARVTALEIALGV